MLVWIMPSNLKYRNLIQVLLIPFQILKIACYLSAIICENFVAFSKETFEDRFRIDVCVPFLL